jgi:hypothetical protein
MQKHAGDFVPREPGLYPGIQKMPWQKDFMHKLIEDF